MLVAAWVPEVVRAGIEVVLRPHRARVELLPLADHGRAHVVLFDPTTPEVRVIAGVPRVALTWDSSVRAVERARALGAVRVLTLSVATEDLLTACEEAHLLPAVEVVHGDDDLLSPREVDVIRGICRGLSNADIAAELFVSVNSVKTYIRTAYRKMGVASRSQALLWGLEHQL